MFRVAMMSKWHVHAEQYARELSGHPNVKITVVWDEDPARGQAWAKELGAEFEPDYKKVLARADVDGVAVVSPTSMHEEIIIAAAEAGKHVFTEKVLTFTLASANRIAASVKKAGIKFAINFPRQSWAANQTIKNALDAGTLGAPTLLLARTSHNGATAGWLPDYFFDGKLAGGGAMMDFGAHPMYLSRWMLGKPVRITSLFNSFTGKAAEDNAVSIVEFENKAMAVIQTNFVCDRSPNNFELNGTKGSIFYEDAGGPVKLTTPGAAVDANGYVTDKAPEVQDPCRQWADACMNNTATLYGIDDAVNLSELMEGAYKSFREKRTVEFAELAK